MKHLWHLCIYLSAIWWLTGLARTKMATLKINVLQSRNKIFRRKKRSKRPWIFKHNKNFEVATKWQNQDIVSLGREHMPVVSLHLNESPEYVDCRQKDKKRNEKVRWSVLMKESQRCHTVGRDTQDHIVHVIQYHTYTQKWYKLCTQLTQTG